jgi:predicted MFS family arabinose efflux permease
MNREDPTAMDEWRRHWPLVMAASTGFGFFSVMQSYTGIFMGPVGTEFGWNKTQLTAGLSMSSVIVAILSPFFGVLIDRWGTRRLALPGLIMYSLVFAGFSLISGSMFQWMAMWVIFALVSLTIKSTVWTAAVASVFNRGRGLAIGVTLSGTALAQVIVPPMGNWLIGDFGWRTAFVLIGTIWGGIAFLLCLFFLFDRHDEMRKARANAAANAAPAPSLPGLTAREALRCAALWRIGLSTFIIMMVTIALVVHQFPILVEAGISRENAALLVSLGGVAGILGKIVTGALLDRYKPNWVGGVTLSSAALAFVLLLEDIRTPSLIVVAMVINGYASGTKLQICGYLTTRYAGLKNFGLIFSIMASVISLSSGLGPLLGGISYDAYGNYNAFLVIGMVGSLISGYLIFGLGAYPHWQSSSEDSDTGRAA